jgi:hypothetical protein
MTTSIGSFAFSLLLALAPAMASAQDDDPLIVGSENFVKSHPDLDWRNQGELAYNDKRYAAAIDAFRSAARYADKPSAAMLATMLWNGEGAPVDHALAYAWMDLAAERGYRDFALTRERFWLGLNADERKRALDVGKGIYDEYGDQIAKPRLASELRRARLKITGSHLGRTGNLVVRVKGPDGRLRDVDGSLYYSSRYWKPELYWQWVDKKWQEQQQGHVDVGPLKAVPGETPPPAHP